MSEDFDQDRITVLDREEEEQDLEPPKKYKVVLLNDDFTPMDFVVDILVRLFGKARDQAAKIMLDVHNSGKGIAGVYTHEIAETKARMVFALAQSQGHPLQAETEPE